MQVLLSPKQFQQAVKLQLIEENERKNLPNIKTPNLVRRLDSIGQTRSSEEDSTLPK